MLSVHCTATGLTDIGKVRQENQDAFAIDDDLGLYVVADGMGGMEEGGLAARFVVEGLPTLIRQKLALADERSAEAVGALLEEAVGSLNGLLRQRAGKGTGATVVLALLNGRDACVAHLGDSPAFLCHEGRLEKLTRDHNVAALLVETGRITPEEARVHPGRHSLTAYVGMPGKARPELKRVALHAGDRLLLCTDGLAGVVADEDILRILAETPEAVEAAGKLIDRANEGGGYDNITAVLIDCQQEGA